MVPMLRVMAVLMLSDRLDGCHGSSPVTTSAAPAQAAQPEDLHKEETKWIDKTDDSCEHERHGCYKKGRPQCCFSNKAECDFTSPSPQCDLPPTKSGFQGPVETEGACFMGVYCGDNNYIGEPGNLIYVYCSPTINKCPAEPITGQVYALHHTFYIDNETGRERSLSSVASPSASAVFKRKGDEGTTLRLLYDIDNVERNCENCTLAFSDAATCEMEDLKKYPYKVGAAYSTDENGNGFGIVMFDIGEPLHKFSNRALTYWNADGTIVSCAMLGELATMNESRSEGEEMKSMDTSGRSGRALRGFVAFP